MEWVLGIHDFPPEQWRSDKDWDERIIVNSKQTVEGMVDAVCDSAIRARRGDDSSIVDNKWVIKIFNGKAHLKRDTDYVRIVLAFFGEPFEDPDATETIFAETRYLDQSIIDKGMIMEFCYARTLYIYLKVLDVSPIGSHRDAIMGSNESDTRDIEAIPAFHLPKDQRIDSFFPNFSTAFLGKLVLLAEDTEENEEVNMQSTYLAGDIPVAGAIWGLATWKPGKIATMTCSMVNSDMTNDIFFAPAIFTDIDEFLQVSERAWTPVSDPENDPNHTLAYPFKAISRYVFPHGSDGDESYKFLRSQKMDPWLNIKRLFFRLTKEEVDKEHPFEFAKVFPKTHAHLTSGLFRWINYEKGVLRVIVGRGLGDACRNYSRHQVLRKWVRKFESLHELLCAVEASWEYEGEPLAADAIIPKFDKGPFPPHSKVSMEGDS